VVSVPVNPGTDELSSGTETFWVFSDVNGRILQAGGNLRRPLNVSERSIIGRDIYTFIAQKRDCVHRLTLALAPNVTIERDLVLRPRDRNQCSCAR
jgi:hypothetical protein